MQTRQWSGVGITLVLVLVASIGPRLATAQCPSLVWSDEFDQAPVDVSKWSYQMGDGCSYGMCGWGNEELQAYRHENAVIEDGQLHIIARREEFGGRQYTSTRIRTEGKGEWTFGRFEARIKLPRGKGIWPAFWMMPTDPKYGGWPFSGEIDIMELVGHQPETVHGTAHFGNRQSRTSAYSLFRGDFSEQYHEFAVEREPGVIRWYLDGYLYHTITAQDVAPSTWPFDEQFHFLLNVAVGGQWPGNPDATTVFPDSMSIDYVRVYDGARASITGPRDVLRGTTTRYELVNLPADASVEWDVPAGAVMEQGQGSEAVEIAWTGDGGTVRASVSSECGGQDLRIDVRAAAPFVRELSFAAFEGEDLAMRGPRSTGPLTAVDNPAPSDLNPSPRSGRYVRNVGAQYDALYLEVGDALDAESFARGERQFRMQLHTDAPAGTEVLIQLEDGVVSRSNYPAGRHSRYQAFTAEGDGWQTLTFEMLDRPDANLDPSGVGSIVVLFAPNSYTGHAYYLDNFDSYARDPGHGVAAEPYPILDTHSFELRAYPNPARGQVHFAYALETEATVQFTLFDLTGRTVRRIEKGRQSPGTKVVQLSTEGLAAGTYIARIESRGRRDAVLVTVLP